MAETTRQLTDLRKLRWSESEVRDVMVGLAQRGQEAWVNFDSARQIAWALLMLRRDIPSLAVHTGLAEELSMLNCMLDLTIPLQDWDAKRNDSLLKLQPALLELRAEYRPQQVAAAFAKIEQILNARP